MIEMIVQVFGMTFVGVIMFCAIWTFGIYIVESKKSN